MGADLKPAGDASAKADEKKCPRKSAASTCALTKMAMNVEEC